MSVHHHANGTSRVVAGTVERADSWFAKGRGLMFRRAIPSDYALVLEFDREARRRLHMVCVPFPIDAVWLRTGVVERTQYLKAWTGRGAARADTVIEFPAGMTEGIEVGDRLVVES
jgi:uncharacterized membrane protein (UPF0127 family)